MVSQKSREESQRQAERAALRDQLYRLVNEAVESEWVSVDVNSKMVEVVPVNDYRAYKLTGKVRLTLEWYRENK